MNRWICLLVVVVVLLAVVVYLIVTGQTEVPFYTNVDEMDNVTIEGKIVIGMSLLFLPSWERQKIRYRFEQEIKTIPALQWMTSSTREGLDTIKKEIEATIQKMVADTHILEAVTIHYTIHYYEFPRFNISGSCPIGEGLK